MLIGYARASTPDQNLILQVDASNAAGCEHIATNKASGATIVRLGLTEALGKARKGDRISRIVGIGAQPPLLMQSRDFCINLGAGIMDSSLLSWS